MAEKYKATPNNLPEKPEVDLKKQKQDETKNTVEDVAKTAATAYLNAHGIKGPVADMVVDKAAKNPVINKALDTVSKNKQVQKAAEKAKPAMDMAKPLLDAKKGGTGGGVASSAGGAISKGAGKPNLQGVPGKDSTSNKGSSQSSSSSGLTSALGGKSPLASILGGSKGNSEMSEKEKTAQAIIKFLMAHPHLLAALLVIALIALIIFIIAFHNNEENSGIVLPIYDQCETIKVKNDDNSEIEVKLEDYVAGVLNGEVDFMNNEALYKAMAVAARTYVLVRTKDSTDPTSKPCSKAIANNSTEQNYKPIDTSNGESSNEKAMKKAALDTAGQIITDKSGNPILTQYDSFCYNTEVDKSTNYEMCQPVKSIRSERLLLPVQFVKDTAALEGIFDLAYLESLGDNGNGMSQFGAFYLATDAKYKWDYKKILHYFYGDDVVINTMTSETPVTSGGGQRMVDIAASELKTPDCNTLDGLKYRNYAKKRVAWCAMFVRWVAKAAGFKDKISDSASCSQHIKFFEGEGQWKSRKDYPDYVPKPGDIVLFDFPHDGYRNGQPDHIGIVEKVENGKVHTIEGNTTRKNKGVKEYNVCARKERDLVDILGYGTPAY